MPGGYHETSNAVAAHAQPGGAQTPNWVVGFNGGWAVSTNLDASTWDAYQITGISTFGDPCDGGHCMSDEGGFGGYCCDPSLATVTQPDANDSLPESTVGQRVLFTQAAFSTVPGSVPDVVVSISDNGGQTFGHSRLLTTGAAQDGGTGGGGIGAVDNPVIASHFASPYSAYAAWTVAGAGKAFITKVSCDENFVRAA